MKVKYITLWGLYCLLFGATCAKVITVSNNIPRLDTDGNIIDCHSGNIVKHGDTYFMYGEHYENYQGWGEKTMPHLYVYSSPDMLSWTNHGPMLMDAPNGTYYTPWVIFNNVTQMFVAWFNVYPGGCCRGNFGVAQSKDGLQFEIDNLNVVPVYPDVDCSGLFVDDDGTAYIIYSSIEQNHQVSIEKLTTDYLQSTQENYGFFPDTYVEGPILFKRNGIYYVGYGSCCCFCRAGSGFTMFSATSLKGPWTRLGADKNCNTTTTEVCGAYGERITNATPIINAQGITYSLIPTTDGTVYMWQGERWLSAPNNNPTCPDECRHMTGICEQPPTYIKGHGFSYWVPLEFTDSGDVKQFSPFVNNFTLNLI